ncbi:MAG: hypothetical protein GXP49_10675 [Deltaproteobacteria bacterium]|nr:hypothetical protein [Deltaproteobacteria bacterium]
MKGSELVVRGNILKDFKIIANIHEWRDQDAYLLLDEIEYKGMKGAVFTYSNPPVHQMGNPALDAYLEGFDRLNAGLSKLEFLLFYSGTDPVHAGGDLKESLDRLDSTNEKRKELQERGASEQEIDALYNWADARLKKGLALYSAIRRASRIVTTVAVCGGGVRFGGSAEVPLMADYLVGDSRSAMCFSEAMIGLIPGWGGVGRTITKAGSQNAQFMAMTCPVVRAPDLKKAGIYDKIIQIDRPLPKKKRTGNKDEDTKIYARDLEENEKHSALLLIPAALELALEKPLARKNSGEQKLANFEDMAGDIERRSNPDTYKGLWGKPLNEVKDEIKKLGRPLAPQSIEKLKELFSILDDLGDDRAFNEENFVTIEMNLDALLYRDPRFREGITATLEQRVADFKEEG